MESNRKTLQISHFRMVDSWQTTEKSAAIKNEVVQKDNLFVTTGNLNYFNTGDKRSVKYNKNAALKIIVQPAKKYEEKLNNQHFLFIYKQGREEKQTQIGFRDMHFLHLTGVKTKLSAQRFYEACVSSRLSIRDFEMDSKGKVQQKLMVLPYLHELPYHNCMIGDFINSGIMIRSDYFIGDTKAVMSVGFRQGKTVDMPVTLYNENIKKLVRPSCKVLAILKKAYNEPTYETITYLSKDYEMGSEYNLKEICHE